MKSFRDLKVWQKGHELTLAVYQSTHLFPKEELYGLTSQLRRSAASIPANIAEGCGRSGNAEFKRFLQVAMGSASELEYHLLLAHELGFLESEVYVTLNNQTIEVKRMLSGLIKKIFSEAGR